MKKFVRNVFFIAVFGLAAYIIYNTSKDDAKIAKLQQEKEALFNDYIAKWKAIDTYIAADAPYIKEKILIIYNGTAAGESKLDKRNWELPETMVAQTPEEVKTVILVDWPITKHVNDRNDTVNRIDCSYQIIDLELNYVVYKKEITGEMPTYTTGSKGAVTYNFPDRPSAKFLEEILALKRN